ncbi:MAG: glycine--tRNA ligase subunit beta [Gammaproteobacteria bacterium]|nr:glycine--tRNA ligase subunit beta [Gammaproteobacteria bacterium]
MATKDFLVEIGTGELPPKALRLLSESFLDGIRTALKTADLAFDSIVPFATPRRLAVRVTGLQEYQADKAQERFGPAVSAAYDKDGKPTPAAAGFARSCGVALEGLDCVEKDGVVKLVYRSVARGGDTRLLLADMVARSLAALPIPKKMRWGSSRDEFVRPVHWVVMIFGSDVVPASILGISSGNQSRGHRFLHNQAVTINTAAEYEEKLAAASVIVDYEQRKALIRKLVSAEGEKLGARVVIEEDLLEEVTSLVEWPVALTGKFDEHFLSVPREALVSSMKSHQKCFYLLDQQGNLLPSFVTVSNLKSLDPSQVIAGNERVIRPRLADARFFYDTDRKQTLASRLEQLKTIVFQQELGTVYEKSQRVSRLAGLIANELSANKAWCERAALLSKCDLVTNMVSEFAELQGIIGNYYALHDGEPTEVAAALNEQYMPRFSGDKLPDTLTGRVLAIADKLDTIVGLFAIGQPPTGSKDPFALRRAALGILRIIVEKELDLDILQSIRFACDGFNNLQLKPGLDNQVFEFLLDRFKAWYQAEGVSAEVFQSVLILRPVKPLDFNLRVRAVHHFSKLPEAQSLASANKRVSNILQKETASSQSGKVDPNLFKEEAEKLLAKVLEDQKAFVTPLFQNRDYTQGLESLAGCKIAIDRFFDDVLVMDDDVVIRSNRIALLAELRSLFLKVADISYLHNN